MISIDNFSVEKSWLVEKSYYIEYFEKNTIEALSQITELNFKVIEEIYKNNNGKYSKENGIYYFQSIEDAKNAIKSMCSNIKPGRKIRNIQLTDKEIEYIRRALINENSNLIHVNSKVKDEIFKKLNI